MKVIFTLTVLLLIQFHIFGQVVNAYAKVTSISTSTLTLSDVDETAHTFEDNEWVVIMQMQDNVIGNTTNTSSFGNVGSINAAGLYEVRQIDSHTESSGTPTTITLKNATNNSYNTCTNCSLQIISFREFGSPDYTTTADMSAMAWNGNVGGVLAINIMGKLTLEHDLYADTTGFRGAITNRGGSIGCTPDGNYSIAVNDNHANKGEGIYKSTNLNYVAGRAPILNAGGGGNSHNAGGGGGGNYTAGGAGGPGWPNCTPTAGGFGGLNLASHISIGRVFMGGGAGSGEGNNNLSTNGANGGGIVLVRANEIATSNTCVNDIKITANGETIFVSPGNDGGGGGGGGGSIILEVENWSITPSCPLTISANGGSGGSVGSGATHGGGGGGGQGVVIYSVMTPTTNITTQTNVGTGGCNNSSTPCNSIADSGAGINNSGIFDIATGPLPIELISFSAELEDNNTVKLNWITASERDNDLFEIERSIDGQEWELISSQKGAGNSSQTIHYKDWDFNPTIGKSYYRLKQVDYDGAYAYSKIETIINETQLIGIYPNPANNYLNIQLTGIELENVILTNSVGAIIPLKGQQINQQQITYDISTLSSGVYILRIQNGNKLETRRFIKKGIL